MTMLQTHYRQPINWTITGLREAQKILDHWYELTADVAPGLIAVLMRWTLLRMISTRRRLFASLHELRAEAVKGAKPAAACLKASAQLIGLLRMPRPLGRRSVRESAVAVDEGKVVEPDRCAKRRTKSKEFQGIRPHPRRTRRHGRRAQETPKTAPPGRSRDDLVMAGLVPAIHALAPRGRQNPWMPGTRPARRVG